MIDQVNGNSNADSLLRYKDDKEYRTKYNRVVDQFDEIDDELERLLADNPSFTNLANQLEKQYEEMGEKEEKYMERRGDKGVERGDDDNDDDDDKDRWKRMEYEEDEEDPYQYYNCDGHDY